PSACAFSFISASRLIALPYSSQKSDGPRLAEFDVAKARSRILPRRGEPLQAPIWYSWQIFCSTISDSGVCPSADCQIRVATSLSVKNVESTADMIIISPPSMRAAMAVLLAMYVSAMTGTATVTGSNPTRGNPERTLAGMQAPAPENRTLSGTSPG